MYISFVYHFTKKEKGWVGRGAHKISLKSLIIGEKILTSKDWQAWTYNLINVGIDWLYRLLQIHLSYNHSHAHCRIVIERKPETSYFYQILTALASLSWIFCQRLHMTIEKGCKYLHLLINNYLIRGESSLEWFNWATHIYGLWQPVPDMVWEENNCCLCWYVYIYIYISHFSA
jgi:hypothetical protein